MCLVKVEERPPLWMKQSKGHKDVNCSVCAAVTDFVFYLYSPFNLFYCLVWEFLTVQKLNKL